MSAFEPAPVISEGLAAIEAALILRDWHYNVHSDDEGSCRVALAIQAARATFPIEFFLKKGSRMAMIQVHHPIRATMETATETALLVTRLNHAVEVGTWDVDLDGGEILFRVAIDTSTFALTSDLVDGMIDTAMRLSEGCFTQVAQVALGGQAAEIAWKDLLANTDLEALFGTD